MGGKGDGMRLYEVRNGKGLEIVLSPDRNGDITRLLCHGINLSYLSPCGLQAVGSPCVDEGEELPLHGSIANLSAERSPFENRKEDGRAIIDWISVQPWCDGNIGTYGGSYLGYTQWNIADYAHPMLKTMFIMVWGGCPYDLFHRRGMFRPDSIGWSAQMLEDNRYRLRDGKENLALNREAFAIVPPVELGERLKGRRCDWHADMILAEKDTDAYWHSSGWKELREAVPKVAHPIYLMGGWFDFFFRSQIESYRLLPEKIRQESRFVIGPWWHSCKTGGTLEYPEESRYRTGQIQAQLYVESTAPATSFTVRVSELFADGRAFNVRDDITDIRWVDEERIEDYEPGSVRRLSIQMTDIIWKLKAGSRVRVDISSSNFPAYHIHPNTDRLWAEETRKVSAKQHIYTGGRYPSCVILPIDAVLAEKSR